MGSIVLAILKTAMKTVMTMFQRESFLVLLHFSKFGGCIEADFTAHAVRVVH